MNDNLHTYIPKAYPHDGLFENEKLRMKSTIHEYMAMKPLRSPVASRSPRLALRLFAARPLALALVLAFFVSSAGISFAAQNTLPGDALYAVKTRINEPVSGVLAVTPQAKAQWAMDVAGERVKEAATLAAEGKLSTATQDQLRENFSAHAEAATAAIASQASTSPDESSDAAQQFEAQLSAYDAVLADVAAQTNVDISPLAESLHQEGARVALLRGHGSARTLAAAAFAPSTTTPASSTVSGNKKSLSDLRDAARKNLSESLNLARQAAAALSTSSARNINLQLENASASIQAASGSDESGRDALQAVITTTEQLGTFLETTNAIHERTGIRIGNDLGEGEATSSEVHSDHGSAGTDN